MGKARFLPGLLVFILAAGCSNLFETPERPASGLEGAGLVRIRIGGEAPARTIQPGSEAVEGYRLIFTGEDRRPVDFTGDSVELYLADGTHFITVLAYKKGESPATLRMRLRRGTFPSPCRAALLPVTAGLCRP
jgi:hypothetical protein